MDDDDDDKSKPRRLEDGTATYLLQLEARMQEEIESDEMEVLVTNVLSEIKQRTASATCDRRTHGIMEKLCFSASLPNLCEIIRRCTPYCVFLARNRHSSHVLQAILSRMCYILKFVGTGDTDEDVLKTTILDFLSPLLKEVHWLVKELCASHVVRSALCTLTGMPVVAERKGKFSKHQHSVTLSEPLDSLIMPGMFYIDKKKCFDVPEEFHDALGSASYVLIMYLMY